MRKLISLLNNVDSIYKNNNRVPIVCYRQFNRYSTIPYIICRQQHIVCFDCLQLFKQKQKTTLKCPFCRRILFQQDIIQDVFLQKCNTFFTRKQEVQQKEMLSFASEWADILSELISFQPKEDQQSLVNCLRNFIKVDKKLIGYQAPKKLLQKIINICPQLVQKEQFLGLGSFVQLRFYGRNDYVDYWYRLYPSRSLCDDLAICCAFGDSYEPDKSWYQQILAKRPNLYQLRFRLAVLEYNYQHTELAKKQYEQVIKINQSCSKAYQALALINLPSKKSYQYAQKYYGINKNMNVFIEYIFAVCGQRDQMSLLQSLIQKYPDYLQPLYTLSRMQQIEGDQQKAFRGYMSYFELSMNGDRLYDFFPFIELYSNHFQDRSLYQEAIPLLLSLLNNRDNIDYRPKIIKWIGKCYANINQPNSAAWWLKRYLYKEVSQLNYFEILIQAYYKNKDFAKVISYFQKEEKNVDFTKLNFSSQQNILKSYVETSQSKHAFDLSKKYKMKRLNSIVNAKLRSLTNSKMMKKGANGNKNIVVRVQ